MKKILFSAALLMGFAAVSFAGNPKGETKDAGVSKEASAQASTTADPQPLYWYDTEGNLIPGSPSIDPSTGCTQEGEGCARGFAQEEENPLTATPVQERKPD